MPLVLIPPGEFDMGSTTRSRLGVGRGSEKDDKYNFRASAKRIASHRVKITNSFYLAIYHGHASGNTRR